MSKPGLVTDYKKIAARQKTRRSFSAAPPPRSSGGEEALDPSEIPEEVDSLGNVIRDEVRLHAGTKKLSILVFTSTQSDLPARLVEDGHRVIVLGHRFPALYKTDCAMQSVNAERSRFRTVEAKLEALPIARRSVDAVVVLSGLPPIGTAVQSADRFISYIKPEGLFLWPHPAANGTRGRLGRLSLWTRRRMLPPLLLEQMTAIAMELGLRQIRQVRAAHRSMARWYVTGGVLGKLPWEQLRSSRS